jgi:hypothetical protein
MNWFGYNERALSLKWFNLGYEATFKLFGPDGYIVTTTLKQLTLFNHLYEANGLSDPKPDNFLVPLASNPKVQNDVTTY